MVFERGLKARAYVQDSGVGVVIGQNLVVGETLLTHEGGSILAQPDSVARTVSFENEPAPGVAKLVKITANLVPAKLPADGQAKCLGGYNARIRARNSKTLCASRKSGGTGRESTRPGREAETG